MKQLKVVLKEHGYKVVDLYNKVCEKYLVDYKKVSRYCRSVNKVCWTDKRLSTAIENALKEMGIEW